MNCIVTDCTWLRSVWHTSIHCSHGRLQRSACCVLASAGVFVCSAAVKVSLRDCVATGAQVVPVAIPELNGCRISHAITIAAEVCHQLRHVLAKPALRRRLGGDVRLTLSAAEKVTASDYLFGLRLRRRVARHFAAAFEKCDVLAMPTAARTAPPRLRAARAAG